MPHYRLVFPPDPERPAVDSETAIVDSGDAVYGVGSEIEHDGRRWRVTEVPVADQAYGAVADLLVWPVD